MDPSACRGRGRGFATIVAMGMTVIVAMALLVASRRLADDASGTRRVLGDARLRQLLHAGAHWAGPIVLTHRSAPEAELRTREWEPAVALPDELIEAGATLKLRSIPHASGLRHEVEVVASIGGRSMRQTLRFVRAGERWGLIGAELGR